MSRLRIVVLVALASLVGSVAYAQQASIVGTATDETKSVLPGVNVTATDQAAGRQLIAVTNEKGEYRLQNIPPGTYTLQAELSGFSTVMLKDVELLVGQNATIPITMKLAQVSETLTVLGESPLVDTSSAQVSGNVDRRQMEQLPLQGRNWMELSKLVKGVTANDIGNSIGTGAMDDLWQLNLDGQQITQKVAGSGFGQPRFSRESIAEFQIVTSMFDITQGRSAGMEIQAISKSGTNTTGGSTYGYFRSDSFNAPDLVAKKVLPYANQQIGATLGGPIVKDKVHYFASYEYEREPGTLFSNPSSLPTESFSIPYKNGQKSVLVRVDDQLSLNNRLSIRGSRWNWENPEVLAAGGHPSAASVQTKDATNVLGTWSRVMAGRQPHPGNQGRLQRLPLDQRAAGRDDGHARVPRARPHVRRAVQLSADPQPEQLDRPRRLQPAQGKTRPEDRRRVHPRPQRRPVVHPARRLLHVQQRADEPRRGDRARRVAQPGDVEPAAAERARARFPAELHAGRLDD